MFGKWNYKKLSEPLNFFCSSLFPRFLHEIRKLMQGRINNPSHSSLPSYLTCSTKQDRVITSSNSLQVFTIKRNYNLPSPANFFFKKNWYLLDKWCLQFVRFIWKIVPDIIVNSLVYKLAIKKLQINKQWARARIDSSNFLICSSKRSSQLWNQMHH